MTKKYLSYAILAIASAFTACSDDDFAVNYSSSLPAGMLYDDDGCSLRLESIGNTDFFYAEDGCLVAIGDVDVDMSRFIIETNNTYNHGRETERIVSKYSFNNDGYVSGLYETVDYDSSDYTEDSYCNTSFSYNYKGQLMSMYSYARSSGRNNGVYYSTHKTMNTRTKYDGGVLTSVECKVDATNDGMDVESEYIFYFHYEDSHENIFYQYTHSMAEAFFENEFDKNMACLGFYGRASYLIPTSIDYEYVVKKNGVEEVEEGTIYCDYMFYRNEAVASADGMIYKYTKPDGAMLGEVHVPSLPTMLIGSLPKRETTYPSQIFKLRSQR